MFCNCGVASYAAVYLDAAHGSCIIGTDSFCGANVNYASHTPSCSYGNTNCKGDGCPVGSNGQTCTVRKDCWSGISCYPYKKTGVWDASDAKCIRCGASTEAEVWATTGSIKLNCDGGGDQGDLACESACGAVAECDEKAVGASLSDVCSGGGDILKTNRFCSVYCAVTETNKYCDSSKCGNTAACGGVTYTCAYSSGQWRWVTGGMPSGSCCDSSDCSCGTGDCVGLEPCSNYQCSGDCSSEGDECIYNGQEGTCNTDGECNITGCSADSNCSSCGTGDCAGNLICSSGTCTSICNSSGDSCSGGTCNTSGVCVSEISAPIVQNESATNIEKDSARIRGQVTEDGGKAPEVTIYWGLTNGGITPSNWDHSPSLGVKTEGSIYYKEITGLTPGTIYYYRNYAVNSVGSDWANDTAQFTTDPDCDPWWGSWTNLGCGIECGSGTCTATEQCQKRIDATGCLDNEYQCVSHSSCSPVSNICPLNTTGNVTISQNCYIEGEMWLKDGNLTIQNATVEIKPGANYILEEGFAINLAGANVYLLKSESYSEINKETPNLMVGESGTKARPVYINNSGGAAKTNNAVLVVLDTKFLIAYNRMRSNCADVRFLDSDNETLLNYWLEPGTCNTTETKAWVKIPEISADSTKTIYFYYGDIDAKQMSNAILTGVVQFKEQRTGSTYTSCISGGYGSIFPLMWLDDSGSLEIESSAGCFTQGKGYAFMSVPKDWINGKYLRWRWGGVGYPPDPYTGTPSNTTSWRLDIYNGALSRTNSSHFPNNSSSVGATLLQSWTKNAAWIWDAEIRDGLVDVSSAASDFVTLVFSLTDANGYRIEGLDFFLYWLEVNEKAEGEDNVVKLDFSANVGTAMMEQESGSLYDDYGLYRRVTGTETSSTRTREISPDCIRRNPEISLFNTSSYGVAGDVKEFNFYVINKDNFACPDSSFNLSNNCPSGWTCSFDQGSVSLPPYESARIKFSITSSSSATAGDYIASLIATNPSSDKANSAQVNYSVMPLYAWWGDGSDGNATISANTDIGGTVKYYDNLTINGGSKLYSSQESLTIFVRNDLVLNGSIETYASSLGGDGGQSGYGVGGKGGGVLTIFARNIIGLGIIKANGANGGSGGTQTGLREPVNGYPGLASVMGSSSGGASSGGGGIKYPVGVAGSIISSLSSVVAQYVNSIDPDSLPALLNGYGGSGAGAGSGYRVCNNCWGKGKGGAGGGGGSMGGLGGNGGKGVTATESSGNSSGGAGGGGAGAGGIIILVSQDLSNDISIQSIGGNGGSGGNGSKDSDGGGGGAGSGGMVVLIANKNIGAELSGGAGGTADEAYVGLSGASGTYIFYDINNFIE